MSCKRYVHLSGTGFPTSTVPKKPAVLVIKSWYWITSDLGGPTQYKWKVVYHLLYQMFSEPSSIKHPKKKSVSWSLYCSPGWWIKTCRKKTPGWWNQTSRKNMEKNMVIKKNIATSTTVLRTSFKSLASTKRHCSMVSLLKGCSKPFRFEQLRITTLLGTITYPGSLSALSSRW